MKERLILIISAVLFTVLFSVALLIPKDRFEYPESDDEFNIAILGDSTFDNNVSGPYLDEFLAQKSGAHVYSYAMGGTTASKISKGKEPDFYMDKFNFYNLADIIVSKNLCTVFDDTKYVCYYDSDGLEKVRNLSRMNFEDCDVLIINYGINDSMIGIPVYGRNENDIYSYAGAMRSGISEIRKKYPDLKIVLDSVTFANYQTREQGVIVTKNNDMNGIRAAYNEALRKIADEDGEIYFFDSSKFMDVNEENWEEYYFDGIHFLYQTKELFSEEMAKYLETIK